MKKEIKAKIVKFFNDYAISYQDNGRLRLSAEVDQFIFLTEKRIEDKDESLKEALKYNLENLIIAPPTHSVRESITIDNALKLLVGSSKKEEVEDETKDEEKTEEVKDESKDEAPKKEKGGIKKVGNKK